VSQVLNKTVLLASLPIAYITVFLGVQNPRKLILSAGADYSYGIYLYGFPIQQLLVHLYPGLRIWYINLLGTMILATMCAFFSWTFVEAGFLKRRKVFAKMLTD
jgi:peptidoglycan/LPS O-acetylase OafA/YrhL